MRQCHGFKTDTIRDQYQHIRFLVTFASLSALQLAIRTGISNSIYLGAAGSRVWVRLGRIRFSARKAPIALKYLNFYSKTRAKNCHPAGRSWPVAHEFETPALGEA